MGDRQGWAARQERRAWLLGQVFGDGVLQDTEFLQDTESRKGLQTGVREGDRPLFEADALALDGWLRGVGAGADRRV